MAQETKQDEAKRIGALAREALEEIANLSPLEGDTVEAAIRASQIAGKALAAAPPPPLEHSKGGVEEGGWGWLRAIKDWCAEEAAEASGEKHAAFQRVEQRLAALTAGPPTQGDIAWAKSVMADRASPQPNQGSDQPKVLPDPLKNGDHVRLSPSFGGGTGEIVGDFHHSHWPVQRHETDEVVHVASWCMERIDPATSDQPKDCGGSGELWTQPPEGHIGSMKHSCPGCNHPDCPNRDQGMGADDA